MRKIKNLFIICVVCLLITSCSKSTLNETITTNTTVAVDMQDAPIPEVSVVTNIQITNTKIFKETELSEMVDKTEIITEDVTAATIVTEIEREIIDYDVNKFAHMYATAIFNKLENTAGDFEFTPIGIEVNPNVGMAGIMSLLYIMDIDFDGTPELFVGTAGTIGGGEYDVFSVDGTFWGNVICASGIQYGRLIDNVIYMDSGVNGHRGYVKFEKGFPAIHIGNKWPTTATDVVNFVTIDTGAGNIIKKEQMTYDELKAAFIEHLDVNYDKLMESTDVGGYPYVQGFLQVPDSENYTKEDIYNCLLELLTKYDELTANTR